MNKKKIEKALQEESKLMYANVFDNVLNKLNIDPSTFEVPKKSPWWKSLKFVSCCSAGLATALIITLAVTLNIKTDTLNSYINLTLQANNTSTEKPSFAYSMSEKYAVNYFIAKNDDAKIIAHGLESANETNGLDLCANIIDAASNTGFIERESKTNIITITVDSSTIDYSKNVANKLYDSIKKYCKANYIYASVEIEDKASDNSNSVNEERYEKINQISQLAEIFNYKDNYEFKFPYYLDSIDDWIKEFENATDEDLDNSIDKLEMLNEALKSDKAKKQFKRESKRAYECYENGLEELDYCLSDIQIEVDDSLAKLQQEYDYDYSDQITYNQKPDSKSFIEKWRDFLSNIDDTNDFENKYGDYHYNYDAPDRPFDKDYDYDYDYDWEFKHNEYDHYEHFNSKSKHFNKESDDWFKWDDKHNKPKDKNFYINKINELVDWYNKIITEYYTLFEEIYLNNVNRIIANVYYHAKDSTNKEYYIDYSKEYEHRNNEHGHHDDESWEEWKKDYDYNWWDRR